MAKSKEIPTGLNIGALSHATGIAAETLRTWERRYGFPCADRTDGGHRVYAPEMIDHLRLVQRALDQGHRTGTIMRMPLDELERLVELHQEDLPPQQPPSEAPPQAELIPDPAGSPPPAQVFERWFSAIAAFDAQALEHSFRQLWYTQGALPFVKHYAGPFTTLLGEAWASGQISVHHEHFASERLRDFLTGHWRPLSDRALGPTILCTTLPGEHHTLGLHMAAVVLAICGCKLIFLGENSPLADILHAAATLPALEALVISCSSATHQARAMEQLKALRAGLSADHPIIVGGRGAPKLDTVDGIERLEHFEQLIPHFMSAAR